MSLEKYIDRWTEIGRANPWISQAYDPPFSRRSFCECPTLDDLREKLAQDNWCLGAAFVLGDLCFINQVDGGDEWLVIKQDVPFESISCAHIIRRDSGTFDELVRRIRVATLEQCRNLEY